ncbi:MAG: RNA polymerase factor sigma-54 [Victivallaceae bacterium]|nr:RNA polymerase factor sigma-54 [Victivallaceae bacterium]
MPGNELVQQNSQTLEQQLSVRQLHSLEFLLLPALALQEKLNCELHSNPLLEVGEPPLEELSGDLTSDDGGDRDAVTSAVEADDYDDLLASAADQWQDSLPVLHSSEMGSDEEKKRDYLFNSLAAPPSLTDQLLAELDFTDWQGKSRQLAETIIGSIDENGYLQLNTADLAQSCDASLEEAEAAVQAVQRIAPPGIGARNLGECLILQLRRKQLLTPELEDLISNHLEQIGRNHLPQIAEEMNIPMESLERDLALLRTLEPHPGAKYSSLNEGDFIVPELTIEPDGDGGYKVIGHDEYLPRIRISEAYVKMLDNPMLSGADRSYITGKLNSARDLQRSLALRTDTLRRIGEVLAETQKAFFDDGVEKLKPMTMRTMAERIGVHETTVSRAISGKYIRTPQGILELRYFFSAGTTNSDGESVSTRAVMKRIQDLIGEENPRIPLSDDKLAQVLSEEGFQVARRTVAKYRESMNIPSSSLRRKHN